MDRMDLTIQEIAQACGGRLVIQGGKADGDTCVSSVVIDSRQVEPQGVFIATVGERVDGHRFVAAAFGKGAALAVVQKSPEQVAEEVRREKVPAAEAAKTAGHPGSAGHPGAAGQSGSARHPGSTGHPGTAGQSDPAVQPCATERPGAAQPCPAGHPESAGEGKIPDAAASKGCDWGCYILVDDTLQALKDIAEAYRKKLSIRIVGITGSVGKTSTKEFIAGVLSEKLHVLKTEGNFNNEIGVPLTLLRIRKEHEAAVVEMGISDFGEMHRLSKMVRPDVCVMTNIGQSHLNNLIDRDGILRAKSEIFDYMAQDGEICLNGEDDKLRALTEIKGHKPHFFGLGSSSAQEVSAVDIIGRGLWGSDAALVMLRTGEETAERLPIHVPQPGRHMVLNAAAAACVARLFGLSGEQIAAGIGKVEAVSGRTHILKQPRHTLIDDCYNANPASVKAAIDLLAMADTERIAILGDMLNLGEKSHEYHEEIGRYAVEAGIQRIYCVGGESAWMYQAALRRAGQEQSGEQESHILHYPHRQALLEQLAEDWQALTPEGSTVLVKASHDMGFAEILEFLRSC